MPNNKGCFGSYQAEYAERGIATFPYASNIADKSRSLPTTSALA
jgi:hypothetical protein